VSLLAYICRTVRSLTQAPNSATDIHQQGLGNICSHNTRLTTPMYF